MTSKTQENECYVYITLPGQTNPVTAGRFALTVDKRGIPLGRFANADNLFSQHARFMLEREQAEAILFAMKNFVKNNWYAIARAEGVSEADCEKIASAVVYPGFSSPPFMGGLRQKTPNPPYI